MNLFVVAGRGLLPFCGIGGPGLVFLLGEGGVWRNGSQHRALHGICLCSKVLESRFLQDRSGHQRRHVLGCALPGRAACSDAKRVDTLLLCKYLFIYLKE